MLLLLSSSLSSSSNHSHRPPLLITSVFTGGLVWANNGDAAGGCFAGTLCAAGMIRAPDLTRDACPQGYYCPAATPSAIPCPAGRYGANTGLAALTDCTITPAGKYSIAAATTPSGLCRPGYYCPAQSTSNTSLACPAGRYNSAYGAGNSSFCSLCVAGGYCPLHSALPLVCPAGYYCPSGASAGSACHPGTYSTTLGLISADQCLPCTGGYFCNGQGLTAPTGVCAAGYYCYSGCNSSTPSYPYSASAVVAFSGTVVGGAGSVVGGICPPGYYCPQNSAVPTPCSAGTFSNGTRQTTAASCFPCTSGHYCASQGLTRETGLCAAGYYCPRGSSSAVQVSQM